MSFEGLKIQTFTGINDSPVAPTSQAAGNGSHLIAKHNQLCDKLDDLSAVADTGSYNDLINKPNLSTVATSGNYNDLTNKPTLPTAISFKVNEDSFAPGDFTEVVFLGDGITAEVVNSKLTITIGTYTPSGGGGY